MTRTPLMTAVLALVASLLVAANAPAAPRVGARPDVSDPVTLAAPIQPAHVTASSSDGSSSPPENAVDDDVASAWRAAGTEGSQWLELDLGHHYTLQKIQQTFAHDDVWRFVVKGSVNSRRWATLVDKSAGQPGRTFAESVNGTYRYVRLEVISSEAAHPASSLDFKVVGTRRIENLAMGRTATASSYKEGYNPTDALDGNTSSYWVATDASTPQWLTVDLGRPQPVLAVEQNFKDFDTWKFKIEGSRDNADWKLLADYTEGVKGQSFHHPTRGTFRYVRLTIIDSASGFWADSTEFKVLGHHGEDSIGHRNLAPGTRAQSSSLKPGHEPFNAVDGDPQTWWEAFDVGTPQTLTVDLGNESLLRSIEQTFAQHDTWRFTIEGSRDESQWTMLMDHTHGAEGRTFEQEVQGTYRYIRVTVTERSDADRPAAIEDLKVLGIGSPVRTRWWEDRSGVARFFPVWQQLHLDDITAQLDTLKAQGHNAIELAPIFEGNRDVWAGLGVTDLYDIHPDVGTFEDLRELLDAAHARDMKILFFANPGYAHDSAPFFQKALRDFANGVDSEERCWFDIRPEKGPYDRWVHNEEFDAWYWARWDDRAPSFHFAKQCWRDEVRKYIKFWMDQGFDGMIFDAPNVYHQTTLEYNNYAITDVMRNYDTFINGEGLRQRGYVTDWHYNSLQDYTITQWAVPPNPGSSAVLDAIESGNPDGLDNVLKGYRDEMVEAGGITQTPPNWGRRDYPVDKRLLEIATLTTMGTLFYVHNDFYTINPTELDFPYWADEQLDMLYTLMRVQSSYDALSPSGLRVKLPTNDNSRYYAFLRTNKDGSVKALVVLNFQDSAQNVTLDLSNIGISTNQTPIDLVRNAAAPAITSPDYTVSVPAYAATVLAVD